MIIWGDLRGKATLKKIRLLFPNTPEGELFFTIIGFAIKDAYTYVNHNCEYDGVVYNWKEAMDYIWNRKCPHAEPAGVNPEYILKILKEMGYDDKGHIDINRGNPDAFKPQKGEGV